MLPGREVRLPKVRVTKLFRLPLGVARAFRGGKTGLCAAQKWAQPQLCRGAPNAKRPVPEKHAGIMPGAPARPEPDSDATSPERWPMMLLLRAVGPGIGKARATPPFRVTHRTDRKTSNEKDARPITGRQICHETESKAVFRLAPGHVSRTHAPLHHRRALIRNPVLYGAETQAFVSTAVSEERMICGKPASFGADTTPPERPVVDRQHQSEW